MAEYIVIDPLLRDPFPVDVSKFTKKVKQGKSAVLSHTVIHKNGVTLLIAPVNGVDKYGHPTVEPTLGFKPLKGEPTTDQLIKFAAHGLVCIQIELV
jgi:hypothetical protein